MTSLNHVQDSSDFFADESVKHVVRTGHYNAHVRGRGRASVRQNGHKDETDV